MTLFTLVLDYRGGTYVSQVRAASPRRALSLWAQRLHSQGVPGVGGATADRAQAEITAMGIPPTPVEGLPHVWCSSLLISGHLALLHIIATICGATEELPAPKRRRTRRSATLSPSRLRPYRSEA